MPKTIRIGKPPALRLGRSETATTIGGGRPPSQPIKQSVTSRTPGRAWSRCASCVRVVN